MALLGAINGIAYSIGFCVLIVTCLKIGPVGLTVTMNNFGLLWPVVVGAAFFSGGKPPSALIIAGLAAVILALAMMPWSRSESGGAAEVTPRWLRLALGGWIMAGVSFTCLFLAGRLLAVNPYVYVTWCYGASLVVLVSIAAWKRSTALSGVEAAAGLYIGVVAVANTAVAVCLLGRINPAVYFPLTVASPAVFMLITGHFVLRERMNRIGWAVATSGIAGIIMLGVSGRI